jgi:ArsR family transcriptional regulator
MMVASMRIDAYYHFMPSAIPAQPTYAPDWVTMPRHEIIRVLADAGRLKVLALAAEEELSVGEMAELLQDGQSQISRRITPLKQAGLVAVRKDGTRSLVFAAYTGRSATGQDPVLEAAIAEGRRLCQEDGSLARLPALVASREEAGRLHFDASSDGNAEPIETWALAPQLAALGSLLPGNHLAVDAGAGEGLGLELLAPLYDRVIAVDRSPARLARCAERVAQRGHANVTLHEGSFTDVALLERVDEHGGADLVFAGRVLHHASRPSTAIAAFARLLKAGGHLVILDYLPHRDEALRREHGDVWLGFSPQEIEAWMEEAGLMPVRQHRLPTQLRNVGPDKHLDWQVVVAIKTKHRGKAPPSGDDQ